MTDVIDREVAEAPARAPGNAKNASKRVYVEGSRRDLHVPFREVTQAATHGVSGDPQEPSAALAQRTTNDDANQAIGFPSAA